MNLNEKVNEKLGPHKFRWIHNFDSLHTWVITNTICCTMWSMISWRVKIFLFLLLLEQTFEWALYHSPCSFLFALHLDWSPFRFRSADKKNQMFANLCSTLVWGSNQVFFSACFYFLLKCTIGANQKNIYVDRQFFSCSRICFHLSTPPLKWRLLFHLNLFIITSLSACVHPPFNWSHLLLEK